MKKIIFLILLLSAFPAYATNTHTTDLEWDATPAYFSITDASQTGLDVTGDLTLQCWVNFESVPTTDYGTWMILTKMNTNNYQYDLFYQYRTAWGEARLGFGNSSNGTTLNEEFIDYQFTTGTWYHISVVYDASAGEVDFYINGTATGGTQTGAPTSIFNGNGPFQVGATSFWSVYFDGLIDDARVYAQELTSTEVADYYDCSLSGDAGEPANLVGHWLFDNSALDETANNNDLSAVNSPTYQTGNLPYTDACGATPAVVETRKLHHPQMLIY